MECVAAVAVPEGTAPKMRAASAAKHDGDRQILASPRVKPSCFAVYVWRHYNGYMQRVQLTAARNRSTPHARIGGSCDELAREIERLHAQIDALVYELYGMTEADIEVVKEGSK